MTRAKRSAYSYKPETSKNAKAKVHQLRVHFKNTTEVCNAIRGMSLKRARKFLHNVLRHSEGVPFRIFRGGVGRHAQAKNHQGGVTQCRYPTKSIFAVLKLLQNAENSARTKGLNMRSLYIKHIQANQGVKMRRRTFRAHGRINPYLSSPSHIEVVLLEKAEDVQLAKETTEAVAEEQ
ncbi:hypothetical protein ABK040_002452 [Willaertia magna]